MLSVLWNWLMHCRYQCARRGNVGIYRKDRAQLKTACFKSSIGWELIDTVIARLMYFVGVHFVSLLTVAVCTIAAAHHMPMTWW